MRWPPISPRRVGPTRSPLKFATSSATGSTSWCPTPGFPRLMTVKDFDELFAVNVRAPYFLVRVSIIGFKNGLD
jgi:hypothetical protein